DWSSDVCSSDLLGNRKKRMRDGFLAFALDQFKDGPIACCVMADLQTFSGQFRNQFLYRCRLVQLDKLAATANAIRFRRRLTFSQRQQLLFNLSVEQIEIEIFLM